MTFVAIDVETTGTLSYVDHIVELAAVRFSAEQIKEEFSSLVNPGVPMPPEASQVNNISDEMLKDQPKITEVLQQFSDFCGSDYLVAHNAIFDFQFLAAALEKHYMSAPKGPVLDTYTLSKKVFPGLSNYRLSTLVEHLKIPSSHFHRAKQDAVSCGYVFNAILKKINNQSLHPGTLIELSGKKELRFPVLQARQLSLFE